MSFIQGVTAANNSIAQDRADRMESRQAKQQKLTNLIKGFEIDPNTGEYAPNERGQNALDTQNEQLKQQLATLTEQNMQIQSVLNKDSMTTTVTKMLKGDVQGGWKTINHNPGLKAMLAKKGMEDLQPVNWAQDKDLLEGVPALKALTPEQLTDQQLMNALNSAYFKVKRNGKWQVNTTESLIKVTGTTQYTDKTTTTGMKNRLSKINEILALKVQNPYEEKLQAMKVQNAIGAEEFNAEKIALQQRDMKEWIKSNPNGTVAEFLEYSRPRSEKTIAIENAINNPQPAEPAFPVNEFNASVEDSYANYSGKGPVFTNEQIAIANKLQDKNKVSATDNTNINSRIALMKGFAQIDKAYSGVDKNAWETIKTNINKYLPADWAKISPSERASINEKIKQDAKLGGYIAEYIKMMSGAAVTDSERALFTDIVSSGKYATKEAFQAALDGFRESLRSSTNVMIDATKHRTPHSYLGYRQSMAKIGANKPMTYASSASTTMPSKTVKPLVVPKRIPGTPRNGPVPSAADFANK